ncbi:hypothetical protein ACEQPO_04765 [Bacillus sp. SL00103]
MRKLIICHYSLMIACVQSLSQKMRDDARRMYLEADKKATGRREI